MIIHFTSADNILVSKEIYLLLLHSFILVFTFSYVFNCVFGEQHLYCFVIGPPLTTEVSHFILDQKNARELNDRAQQTTVPMLIDAECNKKCHCSSTSYLELKYFFDLVHLNFYSSCFLDIFTSTHYLSVTVSLKYQLFDFLINGLDRKSIRMNSSHI